MPIFGLTGVQPPLIYGGSTNCCYTDTWELYLTATISVTINRIYFSTSAIPCPVDVIEVNGFPYTDPLAPPIVLSFGSSIKIKVQACPCQGVLPPNNFFLYNLNIDYTDNTGTYIETKAGGLQEINPQSATYDPVPASLTTLNLTPCIGTTGCDDILATIPFTNYSSFDVPVILDDGGNFPAGTKYYVDGILQVANILFVPGNSTVQLGFSFCWPNSTPPASFFLDVIVCDVYSRKLTVNINPTYCLGCGVGCTDIQIETESGFLPTLTAGCNYSLPSVYSEAAIGEKKTIIWKYSYNNGFTNANFDLYFNPILWTNIQSILPVDPYSLPLPAEGWYIKIQGFMIGTGLYSMYQVTGAINAPSQKNWEVQIEVPNANEFYIFFTFYMTMDIDNEITNTILDNSKRLAYSNIASNTIYQLSSIPDVYNTQRFLSKELFFVDNNVNDPNFAGERPFRCFLYRTIPMEGVWYNPAPYQPGVDFYFELLDPITTALKTPQTFSIFDKTLVRFEFPMLTANPPSAVVVYIFTNEGTDNSVDFYTNNEVSRAQITTIGGPSVLNGVIESPSLGPTLVVGNTYYVEFTVGTNFDPSKKYNVAGIVYDSAGNKVNTWIYTDFAVDTTPSSTFLCCDLDVDYELSDFWNTYLGTNWYDIYIPYKQRFTFKVELDGGLFESQCLANFGYAGDWKDVITDIKLLVSKRDYSLNANNIVYFIYDQYQSFRQTGFPNNWNNLFSDFTVKDLNNGKVQIEWDARGRWEDNVSFPPTQVYIAPTTQPYNLSLAGGAAQNYINTAGINYNWSATANNCIIASLLIRFDLTSVANLPNNQSLYVNKYMEFPICFFPEEDDNTYPWGGGLPITMNPLTIEGCDINGCTPIVGPVCPGDYDYIKITLSSINPADTGYIIGFFNKFPYGILSLQEEDYYPFQIGPNGLVKLDSPYIYDLSPGVQTGSWEFKFDINSLPPGTYQLCAMYVPNVP